MELLWKLLYEALFAGVFVGLGYYLHSVVVNRRAWAAEQARLAAKKRTAARAAERRKAKAVDRSLKEQDKRREAREAYSNLGLNGAAQGDSLNNQAGGTSWPFPESNH